MTKAVLYIRVSTVKQAQHGVSLEAQQAKGEAYANLYDLEIVATCIDAGESAKSLNRPALQDALGHLESGDAEALLVVKLDRLTRSVKDLSVLIDDYFASRFSLLSVSENIDTRTAAGRLVLNILASVSAWEREAVSERTKAAMAHKVKKGEPVGRAPFGFQYKSGRLVKIPSEQKVISEMVALRKGGATFTAIGHAVGKSKQTASAIVRRAML